MKAGEGHEKNLLVRETERLRSRNEQRTTSSLPASCDEGFCNLTWAWNQQNACYALTKR